MYLVAMVGRVLEVSTLPRTDHKLEYQASVCRVPNNYSLSIASVATTLTLKPKTWESN